MNEIVNCNICGEDGPNILSVEGDYSIAECMNCHLIYVTPRPTYSDMKEAYDDDFFDEEEYINADGIKYVSINRLKSIEKRYPAKDFLLDIGCGLGHFLYYARERGWSVQGIDVSEVAKNEAMKRFNISVDLGSVEEVSMPERSINVITMWNSLFHLHDPRVAFLSMKRWLAADGLLVVGPFSRTLVHLKGDGNYENWGVPHHLHFFHLDSFERLLSVTGYQLVDVEAAEMNIGAKLQAIGISSEGSIVRLVSRIPYSRKLAHLLVRRAQVPDVVVAFARPAD